ncbi:MAG: hypothetical protein PHO66_01820 [Eubacteriales bacterium]|nr:hypothetical protein [Eubacteriales bacterium]
MKKRMGNALWYLALALLLAGCQAVPPGQPWELTADGQPLPPQQQLERVTVGQLLQQRERIQLSREGHMGTVSIDATPYILAKPGAVCSLPSVQRHRWEVKPVLSLLFGEHAQQAEDIGAEKFIHNPRGTFYVWDWLLLQCDYGEAFGVPDVNEDAIMLNVSQPEYSKIFLTRGMYGADYEPEFSGQQEIYAQGIYGGEDIDWAACAEQMGFTVDDALAAIKRAYTDEDCLHYSDFVGYRVQAYRFYGTLDGKGFDEKFYYFDAVESVDGIGLISDYKAPFYTTESVFLVDRDGVQFMFLQGSDIIERAAPDMPVLSARAAAGIALDQIDRVSVAAPDACGTPYTQMTFGYYPVELAGGSPFYQAQLIPVWLVKQADDEAGGNWRTAVMIHAGTGEVLN